MAQALPVVTWFDAFSLAAHTVRVLDSSPGLFADELTRAGAEITIGSVTDAPLVDRLTAGAERVFHVAAVFRQINLAEAASTTTST